MNGLAGNAPMNVSSCGWMFLQLAVHGHIDDQRVAVDKRRAHGFELLQNGFPFVVNLIRQFAEGEEMCDAAGLILDPACLIELRGQSRSA